MRKAVSVFSLGILLLLCSGRGVAYATEDAAVCVKYQTKSGWSKGYREQAKILKGSELNKTSKSSKYSAVSTYVVIEGFGSLGETSVIKLSYPLLTLTGQKGRDEQGQEWQISKNDYCV